MIIVCLRYIILPAWIIFIRIKNKNVPAIKILLPIFYLNLIIKEKTPTQFEI